MNQSFSQPSGFRDLLQAGILLVSVLFLFFGASQLTLETQKLPDKLPDADKRQTDSGPVRASDTEWLTAIGKFEQQLKAMTSSPSVPQDRIEGLRNRLMLLRQHCKTFEGRTPSFTGSDTDLGRSRVRIRNELESLLRNQVPVKPPLDLKSKLQAFHTERLEQREKQIKKLYADQRKSATEQHRSRTDELIRQNRELEDQLEGLKVEVTRIQHDTKRQLDQASRKQAFERDSVEIHRLLPSFMTPGYVQLGLSSHDWKRTAEAQPLSYQDLERLGALKPTIKGLTTLSEIGSYPSTYSNTSRPMGAFPAYHAFLLDDPGHLETIKRAQHLLRQHGPYLIETGLLLP